MRPRWKEKLEYEIKIYHTEYMRITTFLSTELGHEIG